MNLDIKLIGQKISNYFFDLKSFKNLLYFQKANLIVVDNLVRRRIIFFLEKVI
jgi:hypothetical protein